MSKKVKKNSGIEGDPLNVIHFKEKNDFKLKTSLKKNNKSFLK